MHQVTFPILTLELLDFLKKRIKKKECLKHGKKARLVINKNETIVTDICCIQFAKTIGQAPQRHQISETSSKIRGLVLNDFSNTEVYIDAIIQLANEKYPTRFIEKIDVDEYEFLPMRERKRLLKTSLTIYSEETGASIEKIWGQFCNLLKIRNCLAHWPIDINESAVKLMLEKRKIRFVKIKNSNPVESEEFDISRANKIVNAVSKLTVDLLEPFYFYRDK